MIDLNSTKEFDKFITGNKASLVYVSTPQCNVCKILKPKLVEAINSEFRKGKT
jgi:hypothetical protein